MQWQIALSDHLCLPQASGNARGASSQQNSACTARLLPTSPTWRRAAGPSTSRVPSATLATTLGRPNANALRCSAVEHARDQAHASAHLQRQVDRLTKLMDTLQAASSWHDKARVVLNICWQALLS